MVSELLSGVYPLHLAMFVEIMMLIFLYSYTANRYLLSSQLQSTSIKTGYRTLTGNCQTKPFPAHHGRGLLPAQFARIPKALTTNIGIPLKKVRSGSTGIKQSNSFGYAVTVLLYSLGVDLVVFLDSPYGEIRWDKLRRIVIATSKSCTNDDESHRFYDKALDCLLKYGGNKILWDYSNTYKMKPELQVWIKSVWTLKAVNAGLSRQAILLPEDTVQPTLKAHTVCVSIFSRPKLSQVKSFLCMEEAIHWLR